MFGALACAIRVHLRKRLSSQNFNSQNFNAHRVRATCSACLAAFCQSCLSFHAEHSKPAPAERIPDQLRKSA